MTENLPDTNVGNIEYIRKQDALDSFGLSEKTRKYGGDHSGYDTRMLYEIQDTIESLEPADVAPVVHSQWKYKCGEIHCPECGNKIYRIALSGCLNFCPNCGADMRGERDGSD